MAHTDAIAAVNLARGDQIRQRLHEQALDGAFQGTRAVSDIGTLRQAKTRGRQR